MRIALMGTRGAPARYGGFETAVEEIGAGLVELGHDVTVYCRADAGLGATYRGMHRVVLPALHRKAIETLSHTALSTLHAIAHRPDVAVVFNAANAPFVALLRAAGIPTALHVDGHDGRRAKWNGAGQRYYSWATRFGARVASRLIVDSQAVEAELGLAHDITSVYIPYGARETTASDEEIRRRLAGARLERGGYHLVVARFEPENNVLEIIQGYSASGASLPLVVVGFQGYPGAYAQRVSAAGTADPRVRLVGAVWDQDLLDAMYAGAASYLHGHSVGGTNPSLLRAMVHGAPVIAYDCPYNRETTGEAASWFTGPAGVAAAVERVEREPASLADDVERAWKRAARSYVWADVASDYETLARQLRRR